MPTKKQRYTKRLNQIFKQEDRMEETAVRGALSMLQDLRKEIAVVMADASEFEGNALNDIVNQVNALIAAFESALGRDFIAMIARFYGLGGDSVTEPYIAAGGTLPQLTLNSQRVALLEGLGLDLVKGLFDDMKRKILTQIRLTAVGGGTPFKVMQEITKIIGVKAGQKMTVRGISYQAERIFRTELNRMFSIGVHDQREQVARIIPDVQKQWLATGDNRTRDTHLVAHGQIVDHDKPFEVGGEDLQYPLDPSGSAKNTIHCRCRTVTVYPDIGAIVTPLDARVKGERGRRERSG